MSIPFLYAGQYFESGDLEALIKKVASEAHVACSSDFIEEQGRTMNEDEQSVSDRTAYLAVKFTSTLPVSTFVEQEGDREELDSYLSKKQHKKDKRKSRKEKRKKINSLVQKCKAYVKDNWEPPGDDGVGFIPILGPLVAAVIWHLIVVLIVRWIILKYFDEPELAQQICVTD